MDQGTRLLRIGIFYDGNYFYHVSNYYCYAHARRARLSIPGLHEFIKKMISEKENISEALCQIVDCHYFRGRLPAMEANARQILLNERVFDDILMREGVVTHYLPMSRNAEKGVDVSLSLETLELTIFKKFNIVVLIASDGDYVPLVRKLNALGTRVMVLGWDFEYVDDNGNTRNTLTSTRLMNEASYPIRMHKIINQEDRLSDPSFNVDSLFVSTYGTNSSRYPEDEEYDSGIENGTGISRFPPVDKDAEEPFQPESSSYDKTEDSLRTVGRIVRLKNGYGFLTPVNGGENLFFFWQELENCDFNDLKNGDMLEYEIGRNERGLCAKKILKLEPQGN